MSAANLDTPVKMCQFIGLHPPENHSRLVLAAYRAYQAAVFVVIGIVSTSMTVQLFISTDLTMVARTIDLWTMCWTGLYKWTSFAVSVNPHLAFCRRLADIQAQAVVLHGPTADRYMSDRLKRVSVISTVYVLSGFLVVFFLSLSAIVTYPKGDRSEIEYFNDPRSYPLCCWMPFTVTNYWQFVSLWILKFAVLHSSITIYLVIDTCMFGALYAAGGQIDLLNETLKNTERPADIASQSESLINLLPFDNQKQANIYTLVSECIKYHNLILSYIRTMQVMFKTLLLFDYFHAVISLTFAMFQITVTFGTGETISLCSYIVICIYHQFFNNFFGEHIIQKQLSVQEAAYKFPWLRINKKSRQLLTVMICRANNPLIISGYYMYKLCFKSFIAFLQAIYTYYMVLRKVNV